MALQYWFPLMNYLVDSSALSRLSIKRSQADSRRSSGEACALSRKGAIELAVPLGGG